MAVGADVRLPAQPDDDAPRAGALQVGADLAEGAVERAGRALRELALRAAGQQRQADHGQGREPGLGAPVAAGGEADHGREALVGDVGRDHVERTVPQLGEAGVAGGPRAPAQAGDGGRADQGGRLERGLGGGPEPGREGPERGGDVEQREQGAGGAERVGRGLEEGRDGARVGEVGG